MDRQPAGILIGRLRGERLQYREVLGAETRPTDDHDHVSSGRQNRIANSVRETAIDGPDLGGSSIALDQAAQHRGVCVVDGAVAQFLSCLTQVSSSHYQAHARAADDIDAPNASHGQERRISGTHPVAGAQH
jgi:hypothetical protein